MKKVLFLTLSILFVVGFATAQKSNGGKKKKKNKQNNNNGGGGVDLESCLSASVAPASFDSYQKKVMEESKTNETLMSIEIMTHAGLSQSFTDNYADFYKAMPRAKVNFGAFSGEARLNLGLDKENLSTLGKSIDGLLQFNYMPARNIKVIIGQGAMYEISTKEAFHQTYLGANYGLKDQMIIISPELRYTHDWKNNSTVYFEAGIKGSVRIMESQMLSVYFDLGTSYRNVSEANYGILYGGFNFMLY